MKRNFVYLIIGALVVVVAVLGYLYYEDQKQTSGIEIKVDDSGVSIETQ